MSELSGVRECLGVWPCVLSLACRQSLQCIMSTFIGPTRLSYTPTSVNARCYQYLYHNTWLKTIRQTATKTVPSPEVAERRRHALRVRYGLLVPYPHPSTHTRTHTHTHTHTPTHTHTNTHTRALARARARTHAHTHQKSTSSDGASSIRAYEQHNPMQVRNLPVDSIQ
jgi:hypothetical protein